MYNRLSIMHNTSKIFAVKIGGYVLAGTLDSRAGVVNVFSSRLVESPAKRVAKLTKIGLSFFFFIIWLQSSGDLQDILKVTSIRADNEACATANKDEITSDH
jgi:hypothetical protein